MTGFLGLVKKLFSVNNSNCRIRWANDIKIKIKEYDACRVIVKSVGAQEWVIRGW